MKSVLVVMKMFIIMYLNINLLLRKMKRDKKQKPFWIIGIKCIVILLKKKIHMKSMKNISNILKLKKNIYIINHYGIQNNILMNKINYKIIIKTMRMNMNVI